MEQTINKNDPHLERATLGGGCFWCLEAVYQQIVGVKSVVSGYAGGTRPNPTYEAVCTGVSGHAEIVDILFDPEIVSFRDLLEIFFAQVLRWGYWAQALTLLRRQRMCIRLLYTTTQHLLTHLRLRTQQIMKWLHLGIPLVV